GQHRRPWSGAWTPSRSCARRNTRSPVTGGAPKRSVGVRLALVLLSTVLVSACGSAGTSTRARTQQTVSAGSCAGLAPAAQFAAARTVFVGTFTPGPSAAIDGQQVLASPARMSVSRFLKGHGPKLVQVQTALSSVGGTDRFSEDGIEPSA